MPLLGLSKGVYRAQLIPSLFGLFPELRIEAAVKENVDRTVEDHQKVAKRAEN